MMFVLTYIYIYIYTDHCSHDTSAQNMPSESTSGSQSKRPCSREVSTSTATKRYDIVLMLLKPHKFLGRPISSAF